MHCIVLFFIVHLQKNVGSLVFGVVKSACILKQFSVSSYNTHFPSFYSYERSRFFPVGYLKKIIDELASLPLLTQVVRQHNQEINCNY